MSTYWMESILYLFIGSFFLISCSLLITIFAYIALTIFKDMKDTFK